MLMKLSFECLVLPYSINESAIIKILIIPKHVPEVLASLAKKYQRLLGIDWINIAFGQCVLSCH